MQYLALSYVSGQQGLGLETEAGRLKSQWDLPDRIPRTTQDAMVAIKRLGYKYLLGRQILHRSERCCRQHIQINNMGSIYVAAHATIVVLGGADSDFGLYAISKLREPQPQAMTSIGRVVSTLPHVSSCIDGSTWAQRGWTFQETLLCRRLLFFTSLPVYYVCNGADRRESIDQYSILDWSIGSFDLRSFIDGDRTSIV
jgi:hypothetical protein